MNNPNQLERQSKKIESSRVQRRTKITEREKREKKNNALKINFFLVGEAFFKQSVITAKGLLCLLPHPNYTSQFILFVPDYPLAQFEILELGLFFFGAL